MNNTQKPEKLYQYWKCTTQIEIYSKLATPKAETFRRQISQNGINVETPLQYGIYRWIIKEVVKLNQKNEENSTFGKVVI